MTKYTDLITSEHAKRPRFVETVDRMTEPGIDQQAAILFLPTKYDLDFAAGVQLDAVGEWVGISRKIRTPLAGVYFSFDTLGVGFDQGYWFGPFSPTQGLTTLPDTPYRLLIRATIALNHWDGTLSAAIDAISGLFSQNFIYIQDNQDMSIWLSVAGPPLDVVAASLLTGGYLALKPVGVSIRYFFTSDPPDPVFGFDIQTNYISGFDTGAWGQSTPVPV